MTEPASPATRHGQDVVPFGQALRAWFAISLQTFGGPAGQIAVMQRTLVEERRWIGPQRFLHALNYCMLLPGPEAQQLAVYVGWLLNGLRGGLAAGILFVLPGMVALLALSAIYVAWGDATAITAIFAGLAPAGAFVIEAFVPDPTLHPGGQSMRARYLGLDQPGDPVGLDVLPGLGGVDRRHQRHADPDPAQSGEGRDRQPRRDAEHSAARRLCAYRSWMLAADADHGSIRMGARQYRSDP